MKGPIFNRLRKDSETSSRRKNKKLSSTESLADVQTTDNSPMVQYESNPMRKIKMSKISNKLTKTMIEPISQEEYDNCRAKDLITENKFRSFQQANSSKSIEEVYESLQGQGLRNEKNCHAQISTQRIKIFYLIPERLLSKEEIDDLKALLKQENENKEKEQSIAFKNGFVIRSIFINLRPDKTVETILSHAIDKINSSFQLSGFSYKLRTTQVNYSFRSSKKTGYPDYDLPGKFVFNYTLNPTICLLFF